MQNKVVYGMGKSFDRVKNKLGSNAGESLAETLVALLISALAIVMLAGVISASSNIITKSEKKLEVYYGANNELTTLSDGLASTSGIAEKISGKHIIITQTASGSGEATAITVPVDMYKNGAFTKKPVYAYTVKQ